MSRSAKQRLDDKHEKLLREEARRHGNTECFDCTQRGPFSIVIELGTFVCNDCAGIHRGSPFNHHIKSISTSSFKPEEVRSILSQGGNENAAKVWLGKKKNSIKPRAGEIGKIRQFMELKYIKKQYYIPPEDAMGSDVPQEDLAETGILDQLPSPPNARRSSTTTNNASSLSTSSTAQDFFAAGSSQQQSFFDSSTQPKSSSTSVSSTFNDTSFFPSAPLSETKSISVETNAKPPASSLLDLSFEQPSNPTPTKQVSQQAPPSSSAASLLDLDFGSPQTQAPPNQSNAFGNFDFNESHAAIGSSTSSNTNDLFGMASTMNGNQNFASNSSFGQGQSQMQGNVSMGMNSFGQSQSFGQTAASSFGSQNSTSLFDSFAGSLGSQQSQGGSFSVAAPRSSLFDDPTPSPAQQSGGQNQFIPQSNSNMSNMAMLGQNPTQQPIQMQNNNNFGQANAPGMQGQNANNFQFGNQQVIQNMQNPHMGMNPQQQNYSGMGQNQGSQSGQYSMGQGVNQMQQPNPSFGQQQPPAQPTSQNISAEQLNVLQQQFIQKLKTLPVQQQQAMSAQYQQWNPQQRIQFLLQNFARPTPPTQMSTQSHVQMQHAQQPQAQEKGKFAHMFGEFDILKSRKN